MSDEKIQVTFTVTIPRDLIFELVQHMRDFDVAYADCHIGIFAAAGSLSSDEMMEILKRVKPPFPYLDVKARN